MFGNKLAGMFGAAAALLASAPLIASPAKAADPITIGFSIELTGGLAAGAKPGLLGMQIWAEDVNAKGGLLGRPVKLIYYDDQSNPANVPGIYTKLIDVDKVDFVVSGYGTNMTAPALPVVIQHNKLFLGLFALAVNSEFHYPRYFSMLPTGPDPKHAFSRPFFDLAMKQNPKPKTLALAAEDAEFPRNASEGIRDIAKELGLKIVYDRTYPPNATDFTPIIRAIQATNPDLVFVASYPNSSVGMLRAATEIGLKTKMFGGGMVGLQFTPIKLQFGPALNGIVDYDWFIPAKTLHFPGVDDFLKKYQAKAPSEGIDPLGWYLPPFAYANLQVLGQAVSEAKTLDHDKLADYIRTHEFNTIVGDISFGKDGEWSKPRVLEVQWQNIKGHELKDFQDGSTEAILEPAEYRTGNIVYPYPGAKQ